MNGFYSGKATGHTPLSQQKEFRAIHNAVIQAAVQLGQLTFEDQDVELHDEPESVFRASGACWQLWSVIDDDNFSLDPRDQAVDRLRLEAESGDPHAQLLLGRLYRDGPLLTP